MQLQPPLPAQSHLVFPAAQYPVQRPAGSDISTTDVEAGRIVPKDARQDITSSSHTHPNTNSVVSVVVWQVLSFLLALAVILVCIFAFRGDSSSSGISSNKSTITHEIHVSALNPTPDIVNPVEKDPTHHHHDKEEAVQTFFVYAMDNQLYNNRVHVYSHDENPTELNLVGSYATGGSGFPFGLDGPANVLASQHALVRHEKWVFACNAGSNEITTFEVLGSGELHRTSVTPTQGIFPVSVAAHDDRLCVISAESRGSTAGMGGHLECFRVTYTGSLIPDPAFEGDLDLLIPVEEGVPFPPPQLAPDGTTTYYTGTPGGDSDPSKNGPIVAGRTPAQVQFTPEGDALIVTAKSTGIFVFPIRDGHLSGPKVFDVAQLKSHTEHGVTNIFGSEGGLPFSFAFHTSAAGHRYLQVTEPIGLDGTIPGGGGVIAFKLDIDAEQPLQQVSGIVHPENEPLITPCWIERAPDSAFMWSANTNEGSITTFQVDDNGVPEVAVSRTLLPAGPPGSDIREDIATGIFFQTERGALALDMAVSGCGDFLYVLDPGFNRIIAFKTHQDGSLTPVGEGTDTGVIPVPANGVHPGVMGITASPCVR